MGQSVGFHLQFGDSTQRSLVFRLGIGRKQPAKCFSGETTRRAESFSRFARQLACVAQLAESGTLNLRGAGSNLAARNLCSIRLAKSVRRQKSGSMEITLNRWVGGSIGTACIAVAVVSFPVPGFPSSLFLVAGIAVLAKSSPAMEKRIRDHRLLGAWISKVESLPRRRLVAVLIVWVCVLAVSGFLLKQYLSH